MRLSSRLGFDFLRPAPQPWRAYLLLVSGALCLSLAVTAWNRNNSEQPAPQGPGKAARTTAASQGTSATSSTQLQAVHRRLNLPWGRIMHSLDASLPEDVVLLSVEPDAEKARLQIGAEAKNYEAMADFLRALNAGNVIRGAVLVTHQVKVEDKDRPIRFAISAQWATP